MNLKIAYKYIFLILVFIVSGQQIRAQVTIGDAVPPLEFITLQIEGAGGMRFPVVDNAQDKTTLTNSLMTAGDKAGGLIIFNAEAGENNLEYWDAIQQRWIKMNENLLGLSGKSGVTATDNTLKLGGALTEDAEIDLNGKDMALVSNSPLGQFAVQGDVLTAKNDAIGVGTANPSGAKLDIAVGGSTDQTNRMRLEDEGQDVTGKVLTSDANGNVSWTDLKKRIEVKTGSITISPSTTIANGSETQISDIIELDKGKWLVFAYMPTQGGNGSQYIWLKLYGGTSYSGSTISSPTVYRWNGSLAQSSSPYTATPQLLQIVDVTTAKYYVQLYISTTSGSIKRTNSYGTPYFCAIKLS